MSPPAGNGRGFGIEGSIVFFEKKPGFEARSLEGKKKLRKGVVGTENALSYQ